VSAEGVIQPEVSYEGRAEETVGTGEIYFVLLTENGLDVLPDQEFALIGHGISLSDKTDKSGEFKHSPVEFGEYRLEVGDGVFYVPAVYPGSSPFQVHVPYALLPDLTQWYEPEKEELGE
jgi:hypothetical protein